MKYLPRLLAILLAGQMLITPTYAFCILGLGNTCKVQDITNTASNSLKVGDVKSTSNTTVGATTVGATTVGGQSVTVPDKFIIGNVSDFMQPYVESTKAFFSLTKDSVADVKLFTQGIVDKQSATQLEQYLFWKKYAEFWGTSPPDININNGKSPPFQIKDDPVQHNEFINVFNGITSALNNLNTTSQTTQQTLINLTNAIINISSSTASIASSTQNNMPFPSTGGSGGTSLTSTSITQTAHGFAVGDAIYYTGTAYALASATSPATSEVLGIVNTVPTANTFTYISSGSITGLTGLTAGQVYYLSTIGTTGNTLTLTEPSAVSSVSKPVGFAISTTAMQVEIFRGTPAQGQTAVVQTGSVTSAITSSQTTTSTSFTDVTGSAFTLPIAGTYKITYSASAANTTAGQAVNFVLTDSANAIIPGGAVGSTNLTAGGFTTGSISVQVTVAGPTSYKLRWAVSAGTGTILNTGTIGNSGNTTITWEQIGASPVPMDLVGEYVSPIYLTGGSITTTGVSSAAAIDVLSITIPTAGTWTINYIVRGGNPSIANAAVQSALYDNSNVLLANSEIGSIFNSSATNVQASASGAYNVTTTGATTYKLRSWSNPVAGGLVLSDNNGRTSISARKISGFTPSSGQTVDYVLGNLTSNFANTSVAGTIIPFVTQAGNISNSSGTFTLSAGKTYKLVANLENKGAVGADTAFRYGWVNTTAPTVPLTTSTDGTTLGASSLPSTSQNTFVITPSVNMTVGVAVITPAAGGSSSIALVNGTYVSIQQLGSSASLITTAVNDQTTSGYFDVGTMRMQWGLFTTTAGAYATLTLPAPFANNTYTFTGSSNNNAARILSISTKTTTNISVGLQDNPTGTSFVGQLNWMAIGLKP